VKSVKSVQSPPPEEEGAVESTCDELTVIPIPHPHAPRRRRKQRKLGVKLSLGRRQKWEESVFRFDFISHYLTLI